MKRLIVGALFFAALGSSALAVSVVEIAGKCGDDAKRYCDGVGYGDAMTECLLEHRSELQDECGAIVDRIKGGEKVSLF